MTKIKSLFVFISFLLCLANLNAHSNQGGIPRAIDSYGDASMESLGEILMNRIEQEPFNLIASLIFLGAILHTFASGFLRKIAHNLEHKHARNTRHSNTPTGKDSVSFTAVLFHFLGEVEAIFGIWVLPLMACVLLMFDWKTWTQYLDTSVNYQEPVFVVIIMSISSTKPIVDFSERMLRFVARWGKESPKAWWLTLLILAPLLGSLITEPAAMTIAALLLGKQFYHLKPSHKLKYATLGLLFVNISVGGTLTHFAAPPILMVASTWNWTLPFVFSRFGLEALLGILCSTGLYYFIFRKELAQLGQNTPNKTKAQKAHDVPLWVIAVHLIFMAFTVLSLHYVPLVIGAYLFFLAFVQATEHYQDRISLKGPLLVGFFLAGLVTHGSLQSWWISPLLSRLGEFTLFVGATVLTAFNDNAAITYLASLVPEFADNVALQHAVVAGAVTGGGLTVIANAPNPAGQSILSKYFGAEGISPLGLFLGALVPTLIVGFWFNLLG